MGFKAEQFVKSVDENLFCAICHEVFDNPVGSKDGHLFCKDCVHIWLKKNTTCPLLGIGYLSKKYLVPQFTVKGIIDNLEVYCHPYGTQDKPSDDNQSNSQGRKEGKTEGRKEERKKGRKEGRKEGRFLKHTYFIPVQKSEILNLRPINMLQTAIYLIYAEQRNLLLDWKMKHAI
ncbi:uncharacterized protein LOC116288896 [Actinia tenebrosa]|uniref:Uncharacterized protein LOC116288896 n=1 Tax=Actinia tenebrosa TaxID=6105 RepID=A0A6P8H5H1_ACTTE|nr:uncharacterized protein LOC116288896 [Actinia tenebrosa]